MEVGTENRNRGELDHLLFGSGRWCQLRQKCCLYLFGKNGLGFGQKSHSGQSKGSSVPRIGGVKLHGAFRKL